MKSRKGHMQPQLTQDKYTQEVPLLPATSAPEENSNGLFTCLHIRMCTYVVADSLELSLIKPAVLPVQSISSLS